MVPFWDGGYADTVIFKKPAETTSPQGTPRKTYEGVEGVEMAASVQKADVQLADASGRMFSQTRHIVRTAGRPDADQGDRFEWTPRGEAEPHVLIVQGHPEPLGIGDVAWLTPCLETR